MKQSSYTVKFLTPAFLGNAQQSGQWRTPPFKALMRQWWRVVYAARHNFQVDVNAMRKDEGKLFGMAGNEDNTSKSKVRIRLDHWNEGLLSVAPKIGDVVLGQNGDGPGSRKVDGALYLGYGPVESGKPAKLKARVAIDVCEQARLHMAFPDNEDRDLKQTLSLINAYGAVGGRSRNGWGSLMLLGDDLPEPKVGTHDWKAAMQLDWPHALGRDEEGPLIWVSEPKPSWEAAMGLLAQIRADMRRVVPERWMLAYPVTKSRLPEWDKQARVPHSLRFKVRFDGKNYTAVIFHMPCRPPAELWEKLTSQKQQAYINCFSLVHEFLDRHAELDRKKV